MQNSNEKEILVENKFYDFLIYAMKIILVISILIVVYSVFKIAIF